MLRPLYRSGQVWHALRPRVIQADLNGVREHLGPGLAPLFFSMERRDQGHAIRVMQRLLDGGVEDRALLTAALLHDCGKGAVPVWLRIARVLAPSLVSAAAKRGDGWRAAAHRLTHHADIGAERARAAGADPRCVELIRGRVGPENRPALALLLAADDVS